MHFFVDFCHFSQGRVDGGTKRLTLFHGLQIICLDEVKVSKIYDWKINDIDLEGKSPSVAFPPSECPM